MAARVFQNTCHRFANSEHLVGVALETESGGSVENALASIAFDRIEVTGTLTSVHLRRRRGDLGRRRKHLVAQLPPEIGQFAGAFRDLDLVTGAGRKLAHDGRPVLT